jgi:hypothetical protein
MMGERSEKRPKEDKKNGQRNPRIHIWHGATDRLAELKAIKVVRTRTQNPRRQ